MSLGVGEPRPPADMPPKERAIYDSTLMLGAGVVGHLKLEGFTDDAARAEAEIIRRAVAQNVTSQLCYLRDELRRRPTRAAAAPPAG